MILFSLVKAEHFLTTSRQRGGLVHHNITKKIILSEIEILLVKLNFQNKHHVLEVQEYFGVSIQFSTFKTYNPKELKSQFYFILQT